MNGLPPPAYFQELTAYLQWQTQKLQELENKVGQLQEQLDKLNKQRTMTVEKIEYKFDQLKIEKLDGTLHIGISPELSKSIEDFTVDGAPVQMTKSQTDSRARIRERIDRFLDEDGRKLIQDKEGYYRIVLGQDYAEFMIQDMKGQVDQRIAHYMQTLPDDMQAGSSKEDVIVNKIKSDITVAIDRHLQEKKTKGDDAS